MAVAWIDGGLYGASAREIARIDAIEGRKCDGSVNCLGKGDLKPELKEVGV